MSTVLAYTSPARGHIFPLTPVLLELLGRGHNVVVHTLASQVAGLRELGLDAHPLDPAIEGFEDPVDLPKGVVAAIREGCKVFIDRAPYEAADLRRAIAAAAPDVLIVDINSWGGLPAAEESGLPWVEFSPYTPPIPSRDVPPFGPGIAPAHGPLGRIRDRVLRPLVTGTMERALVPLINGVRTDVGVPAVRDSGEAFTRSDALVVTTAEPFEYPRSDWPAGTTLIGPCAYEPTQDPPTWLDEITAPIVLVTTSSEFQNDGALVRVALEALRDEPVHVVATVPAGIRETYDVPANAHVEEFVPHGPVLERAAVAITHGGMGATQRALAHGVPVCVVPFGRDQHEVARRVLEAGAGSRVKARKLTPERLRSAVHEARGKSAAAGRIRDAFARAGGASAGADVVEALLRNGVPLSGRPSGEGR